MAIMVQISELILRDEDKRPIFEDLHFRLQRGEWASVVGPDGAGKTTLLQLISGEIRPDRGQILVDDRNIVRIQPERLRELRQRIGIVPHNPPVLRRQTLLGALIFLRRAFGTARPDAEMKGHEVLALVELGDLAHRAVDELNQLERQRFHLALALSHDPVLLLLDDPLNGLDEADRRRYLQLLERIHLRRRLSILLTTAGPDSVRDAPSTGYRLQDGRLAPSPSTAAAASNPPEEAET
mgnify:CR=1 FL=1